MKKAIIPFNMRVGKEKPNTLKSKEKGCPFCDRETLRGEDRTIEEDGPFLLLENKYPTFENAVQTVLIETDRCGEDLSTYPKEKLRALIRFAAKHWLRMDRDERFKSAVLVKNHGLFSGASIHHAHMQIVGFYDIQHRDLISSAHFEGPEIRRTEKARFTVSNFPKSEFLELNAVSLCEGESALDDIADFIQTAVRYILGHFNSNFASFNLAFYELNGKIAAKIISRGPSSVYLLAYGMSQTPSNTEEIADEIRKLYFE